MIAQATLIESEGESKIPDSPVVVEDCTFARGMEESRQDECDDRSKICSVSLHCRFYPCSNSLGRRLACRPSGERR